MPKDFDECVNNGGHVRTVNGPSTLHGLKKGEYRHVCFLKGEMHRGEVKHIKDSTKKEGK